MKKNKLAILISSLVIAFGGCNKESPSPARLQFVSMVPSVEAKLEITSQDRSSVVHTIDINYASPSGYRSFEPGRYTIRYYIDGHAILSRPFVLGKNSYQTLLVAGMKPDDIRIINPKTFWYSVKQTFAGSEATSINGYMPQFIMLRDGYDVAPQNGKIRLINAAPLSPGITLKTKKKSLFSDIIYPRHTEPSAIKTGQSTLNFYIGKVPINQKEMIIKNSTLQTVIIGNSPATSNGLKVTSYQTNKSS